jgi:formate hydrogenlyase subunit 6/NADH:ubiquinone oxidoreductase subunit I
MKPEDLSEQEQDRAWYGSHLAKRKSKAERPAINFGHCMFCGFCEDYCPTGAMTMTDFYELADTNREGLIYPARSMKVELEELPQLPLTNYMMESPVLDADPCIGCSKCVDNCPTNCIIMDVGPQTKELKSGKKRNVENPYFDYTICIGCSTCVKVCPASCLHMEPISNSSSSGLTKENASQEA